MLHLLHIPVSKHLSQTGIDYATTYLLTNVLENVRPQPTVVLSSLPCDRQGIKKVRHELTEYCAPTTDPTTTMTSPSVKLVAPVT